MLLTLPNVTDGCQQTASIMADDILAEPLPIATGPRWGLIRSGPASVSRSTRPSSQRFHEAYRRDGQFLPYSA